MAKKKCALCVGVEDIEDVACENLYCPNCFARCELERRHEECVFLQRVVNEVLKRV